MKNGGLIVLFVLFAGCQRASPPAQVATLDRCFGSGATYSERRKVCEREIDGVVWDEITPNMLAVRNGECPQGFERHPGSPAYCVTHEIVAQWLVNTAPTTAYAEPTSVPSQQDDQARAMREIVRLQRESVDLQRAARREAQEAALRSHN